MAVPAATLPGLTAEGIDLVDDLEEFDDSDLKQVMSNLRKPAGTMADPANPGNQIPIPPYVFGAKSYKRLKIAAAAVRYYLCVGRETSSVNMHFVNVLKEFGEQWQSLVAMKDNEEPSVPRITRSLPIVKWTESFEDFLHEVVGHRCIPLAYLIREEVVAANPPPPLANRRCYSAEHGSVKAELIARATHDNTKYSDDNQKLYSFIEEATRTTQYAASIRPYARRKDGRGAYLALKAQYAGRDKWQKEINNQENFIHTRVWKGNTNFSLEGFITQHRAAHVSLQRCSQHIQHQLPNERTRVTHLLNAINTSDAQLQVAIAYIKSTEQDPTGLMSSFEDTAAYLIQFDPVSRKRKRGGGNQNVGKVVTFLDNDDDNSHDVSAVKQDQAKTKRNKCPDTGVEYCYYKPDEYRKLTKDQKASLKRHRESSDYKGDDKPSKKRKKNDTKRLRKQVIAVIKSLEEEEDDKNNEEKELHEFIVSVVNKMAKDEKSNEPEEKPSKSTTLKAIVKRLGKKK